MLSEKSSIVEIQEYLATLDEKEQEIYLKVLYNDKRKSVQSLVRKYQALLAKKFSEKQRLQKMWEIENSLYNQKYKCIVGIDEAGRGPLAGPVVAGAVILPPFCIIEGLKDSKKINPNKRKLIADEIKKKAIRWAIGVVDAPTIDRINILEATKYAMYLAFRSLAGLPDYALIDGLKNPLIPLPQMGVVKGDNLSVSIAAASIIAKVHRDNIMETYDRIYPSFYFASHKGYGTQQHLEAIGENGCCNIHRKTFAPIKEVV